MAPLAGTRQSFGERLKQTFRGFAKGEKPKPIPEDAVRPSGDVTATYNVVGFLGRGAFADVWLLEDKESGKHAACKVIDTTGDGRACAAIVSSAPLQNQGNPKPGQGGKPKLVVTATFKKRAGAVVAGISAREVAVLKELAGKHDGVTTLYEVFATPERHEMVMEYCAGGDLASLIATQGRVAEPVARVLFRQLVAAVAHCHEEGFMHRDIKPQNVLFTHDPKLFLAPTSIKNAPENLVKLADLGVAVAVHGDKKVKGDTGSRLFSAPEVYGGQEYGLNADVWSLGVVLYAMLSGTCPNTGYNHVLPMFWKDILKGKVHLDAMGGVSKDAQRFIHFMLEADPNKRPAAQDLLAHPWLAET